MSLKISVGSNEGSDAYVVGANAAQSALTNLGASDAHLAIVFASVQYDQQKVIDGVRSVTKDALLVGCSTAGEITTEGPLKKHSVSVMLMNSDAMKFYGGVGENIKADPRAAGKIGAEKVKEQAGADLKAFMMFPDVLVGNGADIVRGVLDSLAEP